VSIILALIAQIAFAGPLGTEFTYQGRLEFEGELADGVFDLRFVLYDATSDGTQVGPTVEVDDATVSEGLFTVELDFGAVFGGSERWLEVAVREGASTGAWGVLEPRQLLMAAPSSLYSAQAASAATAASSDDAVLLGGQPPAFYLDWTNLIGVPGGLDDGDQDLLASLSCTDGQVVKTASGVWVCAEDGMTLPLSDSGNSPSPLIDIVNADGSAVFATGGTAGLVGIATLPASMGVEGIGVHAGGHFVPADGSSEAKVGRHDRGVWAQGVEMGATFFDQDDGSEARMAYGNRGMEGFGLEMGAYFKDTDDTGVAKLAVGDRGIEAYGTGMGGIFQDLDNSGLARLAIGARGIEATGGEMGGYFADSGASGYAYVGHNHYGIAAYGDDAGGYFRATDGSGQANVGVSGRGIEGYGAEMGGYFEDIDNGSHANVAVGGQGITATGSFAGGIFSTPGQSGYARVGAVDRGIEASGLEMGGYFSDKHVLDSGVAKLAVGDVGIIAEGDAHGGQFWSRVAVGSANLASGEFGVVGYGRAGVYGEAVDPDGQSRVGGQFEDPHGSGSTKIAYFRHTGSDSGGFPNAGEYGVYASGNRAGGYFEEPDESGYAYLAINDYGIIGRGLTAGGTFLDLDTGSANAVGIGSYKIQGTGSVAFVQNHPEVSDSVIVFNAPEGDEVATYNRGSARLVSGEATVSLGETFKWVTNPDIGLTTYLTPLGDWCDLYVAEQATDSIIVRSRDASDCAFNYLVYGLRIGFEESSIVQEKEREAYIPSMADHRELYERRPELRAYNSLERFKAMREAAGKTVSLDLSRAHALRDAIVEFDPAVHSIEQPDPMADSGHNRSDTDRSSLAGSTPPVPTQKRSASHDSGLHAAKTQFASPHSREVAAGSFRASADTVSTELLVAEAVEPGDVLVVDPASPGVFRRAAGSADRGVVGIVAADSGLILGSEAGSDNVAPVAFTGIVDCKVDANYGAVWPGDLLVSSLTPGHAQKMESPLPGTVIAKALEPLAEGTGMVKVVVMLR